MDPASDRRSNHRVIVGPDVTIQFSVNQIPYRNVRITNLGLGGCFATLPKAGGQDRLFHQGTLLEALRFEHDELVGEPFLAKVAWVLESGALGQGGAALLGLGLRFGSMPPHVQDQLNRFIAARS